MQVLPVHLHVTPALNGMTIVEVSRSVRNLAAMENYSFFTYLRMQMLQKTNTDLSLFLPQGYWEIQLTVQELLLVFVVSLPPLS